MKMLRIAILLTSMLALLAGMAGVVRGQSNGEVFVAEVDGIISSATQKFFTRLFDVAEKDSAALVVVMLDTPGGELSATREIVEVLLESNVPSAVYVSPRGARAGSAGTFITAAANFAVMAPGTNIGAATPISGTGDDLPETLAHKVTNDAAALIRSIADERGRNGERLEETVREASSFTAVEAVEFQVVDFIAEDLDDLLQQLHGQTASTPAGEVMVLTEELDVRHVGMNFLERLLNFLADPNVAFLLISLGGLGLTVEILNPGLIIPGVAGAILLILAFLSVGSLPVNWAGVVFILLAFALFALEVIVAGFGALGVGAIVSFILGSFILFAHFGPASPTAPSLRVSLAVLIPVVIALGGGAIFVWRSMSDSRGELTIAPSEGLAARLVGKIGHAVGEINPEGVAWVDGEEWSATMEGASIAKAGAVIRVARVEGMRIYVVSASEGPRE
ncbi:MAG: membrane-bound serine protease (ClpP class) [Chloroflexi bacterium]|jgi:membrane-bound serine protease (ClpP class)|nr:MAG: membrane-bound serine protease (ClpP class) [Chloroflexota bacterium]